MGREGVILRKAADSPFVGKKRISIHTGQDLCASGIRLERDNRVRSLRTTAQAFLESQERSFDHPVGGAREDCDDRNMTEKLDRKRLPAKRVFDEARHNLLIKIDGVRDTAEVPDAPP